MDLYSPASVRVNRPSMELVRYFSARSVVISKGFRLSELVAEIAEALMLMAPGNGKGVGFDGQ